MRTLAPALSTSGLFSSMEGRDRPERRQPRGRGPPRASHLMSAARHPQTTSDRSRRQRTPRVARDGDRSRRAPERCAKRGSTIAAALVAKNVAAAFDVVLSAQPTRRPAASGFTFPASFGSLAFATSGPQERSPRGQSPQGRACRDRRPTRGDRCPGTPSRQSPPARQRRSTGSVRPRRRGHRGAGSRRRASLGGTRGSGHQILASGARCCERAPAAAGAKEA